MVRTCCLANKRPIRLVAHGDGAIGGRRNQGRQVCNLDMRPFQRDTFSGGVLQHKAVGFQVAVLFQQADPALLAAAEDGHEVFGQIPTIEKNYAEGG